METKKKTAKRKASTVEEVITISLSSTPEEVSLWLQQKGFDPSCFEDWDGLALFGASRDIFGQELGDQKKANRLFSTLNSLRSLSSAGQ